MKYEQKGLTEVMVEIEVTTELLTLKVQGMDKIWALKSRIEVPLSHVLDVETYYEHRRHDVYAGDMPWKVGGTGIPGVIKAGTYYQGVWAFWDVHSFDNAIVIHLAQEHYKLLVVEVANPDLQISTIKHAICG